MMKNICMYRKVRDFQCGKRHSDGAHMVVLIDSYYIFGLLVWRSSRCWKNFGVISLYDTGGRVCGWDIIPVREVPSTPGVRPAR